MNQALACRALVVSLALGLLGALAASCSSSKSASGIAAGCSLNSDCQGGLFCVFGACHQQCVASRDCPSGQRCVPNAAGQGGTFHVCQLPVESSCGSSGTCAGSLLCSPDQQCRAACQTTADCASGQYCLQSGASLACYQAGNAPDMTALVNNGVEAPDGSLLGASDGSADSSMSTSGDSGGDSSVNGGGDASMDSSGEGSSSAAGGDTGSQDAGAEAQGTQVNPCASAQTQFAFAAMGDANPSFTSGVGARTATQLLIFSGYSGPDPSADAGDAGTVNVVYVQAFDPTTGNNFGPATPLFHAAAGPGFAVQRASIAPSGQIALTYTYSGCGCPPAVGASICGSAVYDYGTGAVCGQASLWAAFLAPSVDAGASPVTLLGVRQLETTAIQGQPSVVWSPYSQSFVFSWMYYGGPGWFLKVAKYQPSGLGAGGGVDVVPTASTNNELSASSPSLEQGSVATSGSLVGVAFLGRSSAVAENENLTVLDADGNEVTQVVLPPGGPMWVTVAGTPDGFVYFYDGTVNGYGVTETFISTSATSSDAGVAPAPDGGYPGFLPTSISALDGHAITDETTATGGVGLALLFHNEVSFAYVSPDGSTHVGPNQVISHSFAAGDQYDITVFNGSFGVSLYDSVAHATQMSASGCAH